MGRISSNRKIAEALLKTLNHLESDPNVDANDPSFLQLKCNLLERLISLELGTAATPSLHLVKSPDPEPSSLPELGDEATATESIA